MTVIVLFGGRSDERHVSVASAQNIVRTLGAPLAWFWAPNGEVYDVNREELLAHPNPFVNDFQPSRPAIWPDLEMALDTLPVDDPVFLLALHGGEGEDGTVQRMMEARRPATENSAAFILKMEQRISRVLAYLDSAVTSLEGEPLRVDQITIACALEYVDLRFTAKWRERFPAISDWLAEISIRPSMIATAPRRTDPISVR